MRARQSCTSFSDGQRAAVECAADVGDRERIEVDGFCRARRRQRDGDHDGREREEPRCRFMR